MSDTKLAERVSIAPQTQWHNAWSTPLVVQVGSITLGPGVIRMGNYPSKDVAESHAQFLIEETAGVKLAVAQGLTEYLGAFPGPADLDDVEGDSATVTFPDGRTTTVRVPTFE